MRTLLAVALLSLAACHRSQAETAPAPVVSVQQTRARRAAQVPEATQRHWTYLNRIRQDEALSSSIYRTLVDDQNLLGVVLYSTVKATAVPDLMRQVLTQIGEKFPHEDATVVVYMTGVPPRKIGIARLDGKTEKTTYAPL